MNLPTFLTPAEKEKFLLLHSTSFAEENELPLSLAKAAFQAKLGAVPVSLEQLEDACQEESLEEFWTEGNSRVWTEQLLREEFTTLVNDVNKNSKELATPQDCTNAVKNLLLMIKPDERWLKDVTFTALRLEAAKKQALELVGKSVERFANMPLPPEFREPPKTATKLDNIRIFRPEVADLDEFFQGDFEGSKILLLKRPEQEFYYAVLHGPDGRNWLSYGSYSQNKEKAGRTFKSENNIQLRTQTCREKLVDKWTGYADRLWLDSRNVDDLKNVWENLEATVPALMPTSARPEPKPSVPVKPPVAIEDVQF